MHTFFKMLPEVEKRFDSSDIHSYLETAEGVRLTVGSGFYHFKYRNARGLRPVFTEETKLIDFLDYLLSSIKRRLS